MPRLPEHYFFENNEELGTGSEFTRLRRCILGQPPSGRVSLTMSLLMGVFTLFLSLSGFMLLSMAHSDTFAAESPAVSRFPHIYEPSGVLSLPGGDILIIEDDGSNPIHITRIADPSVADFLDPFTTLHLATPVSDLEGITPGRDETVFLITSFSVAKKKKKRKQKRQRLIQFQIKDGRIIRELHFDNLLPYLTQQLRKEKHVDSKDADTLNIEGITFDKEKDHLLIGLRSPLTKGKAIIIVLENPYDIFSGTTPPRFSVRNIVVNLDGEGIRGMTYDHILEMYLITNEVKNRKGKLRPALWAWDGNSAHKPVRVSLPKLKGVKNIEGITSVSIGSRHFLFLVCDDGERKKGKGAHYILMDAGFLSEIPGSG